MPVSQDKDNLDDARPGEPLPARLDRMTADLVAQARSEAWKLYQQAPHALELDELISLAFKGLAESRARWMNYCTRRGYDHTWTRYYVAYCLRRIRGSMLDAMRASDWVTRSVRSRAKLLRDAGLDQGKTEAQLAEATGLTVEQIRDTVAAMSRKPVSMDAEPVEVAVETASVESDAMVSAVLAVVDHTIRQLPGPVQQVLSCVYFAGLDLKEVARLLDLSEDEVKKLHATGVAAVHIAMLRAVA